MVTLNCSVCTKSFNVKSARIKTAKYCSSLCYWGNMKGKAPWNKGIKTGLVPKTAYKKGDTRGHRYPKGHKPWNKGIDWIEKREEGHPNWKGDNVGYGGLHTWVRKHLEKAERCEYEDCIYPRIGANKKILPYPKQFEWANISHEYKRDLSDWIQLCQSDHWLYDHNRLAL